MKKIFAFVFAILFLIQTMAFASVHVRSYTKRNGTHVASHHRSNPDGTRSNNWSHRGNVNPFTGKKGYKN